MTLRTKIAVSDCTMLHCVRPISLNIWRVERSVCVWPSCSSRPISSSTVVTFSSVCACFGLLFFARLFLLPEFLFHKVSRPSFCSLSSKVASVWSLNHILWTGKFLISSLSSLLNGMFRYRYVFTALKIIICNNIVCFCLQTPKVYLKLSIV